MREMRKEKLIKELQHLWLLDPNKKFHLFFKCYRRSRLPLNGCREKLNRTSKTIIVLVSGALHMLRTIILQMLMRLTHQQFFFLVVLYLLNTHSIRRSERIAMFFDIVRLVQNIQNNLLNGKKSVFLSLLVMTNCTSR